MHTSKQKPTPIYTLPKKTGRNFTALVALIISLTALTISLYSKLYLIPNILGSQQLGFQPLEQNTSDLNETNTAETSNKVIQGQLKDQLNLIEQKVAIDNVATYISIAAITCCIAALFKKPRKLSFLAIPISLTALGLSQLNANNKSIENLPSIDSYPSPTSIPNNLEKIKEKVKSRPLTR